MFTIPTPLIMAKNDSMMLTSIPKTPPSMIPKIPPKNPIIIDSVKNNSCTSDDFMPIAFMSPTSRVRSNKETVIVLNIPSAATESATMPRSMSTVLAVANNELICATVSATERVIYPMDSICRLVLSSAF